MKGIVQLLFCVMFCLGNFGSLFAQEKGKILMIIAPNNFRDEELLVPKKIFEENGYEVVIASLVKHECVGMLGARVKPDITINEVSPSDYIAIVMVGGSGSRIYFDNSEVQDLLTKFYKQGKVVAAICLAPVTLANAGLLKGKKATVWRSEAKTIMAKGAKYSNEDVVNDQGIVTGAGPFAAEKFAYQVLKEIEHTKK